MASNLIEFRVELPLQIDVTKQAAIIAFRQSMVTLCPIYDSEMYKYINDGLGNVKFDSQSYIMSGYLATAQQAAALGFLNTLNAALGKNVLCVVVPVTSEP